MKLFRPHILFKYLYILNLAVIGVSPGRVDQYTYPCYRRDKENGTLTDEQAIELINCFRIKFNTFRQLSSKSFMNTTSGEAQFHNITLGGTDCDGNSAVNEVSYLFLEAALRLRTPHPTLSVRYFDEIPQEFMDKALQVVAQGGGYPAFFNDKAQINTMIRYGVSLKDARNYALGGCVQAMAAGMTAPGYPVFMNFGKCMELALYDGYDEFKSKKQIGPHTGKFPNFKNFDQFYDAFKKQVVFCSSLISKYSLIQRSIRDSLASCGFTDALIDGCIENRHDQLRGRCQV